MNVTYPWCSQRQGPARASSGNQKRISSSQVPALGQCSPTALTCQTLSRFNLIRRSQPLPRHRIPYYVYGIQCRGRGYTYFFRQSHYRAVAVHRDVFVLRPAGKISRTFGFCSCGISFQGVQLELLGQESVM
ncbi:hypothetical protein Mapa_013523 [Marchantia paleacea]|nr:hypothetical protein Mapa_013523 [Marchantia paleacea]